MIFPVCEKKQAKNAAIIACWILIICIAVIAIVAVNVTFEDIASLVAGIVAMTLFAACCIATILLAVGNFNHVVINECGVTLCLRSLAINYFAWNKIKRVEVVKGFRGRRGGKDCTVINVLTTDKESSMFKNKVYVENINRRRISFLFSSEAIELIKQYYDGKIYYNV